MVSYDGHMAEPREAGGPITGTLIGRHLGEFELVDALGEGGFGAVFRAHQAVLRRDAVV